MKKILSLIFAFYLTATAAAWAENGKTLTPSSVSTGRVDVDLTVLNSMLVYAEVYHMLIGPEEYLGKTVKMNGLYYSVVDNGQDYHFVIIGDALACCQQGMEFKWNGEHSYPGDYPANNTNVEVIGVFDRYEMLGKTYYYLEVDDIVILP
jgi:hypothetical protein